jgi:hypothetical protein
VAEVVRTSLEWDLASTFFDASLLLHIGVVSEVVVARLFFHEWCSLCAACWYRMSRRSG